MSKINFYSFTGFITQIEDYPLYPPDENTGCHKFITVQDEASNVVHFIASPNTYFLRHETVRIGDKITGYYDADTPVILIYPPQFGALVIAKEHPDYSVKVDYFNEELISSDGTLQLNILPETPILLTNGQEFTQDPRGRNLIVRYNGATKSIPAMTTPSEVIVYCRQRV